MIDRLEEWCARYPIASIEDGLFENDWKYWPELHERLSSRTLILGDDLLCHQSPENRKSLGVWGLQCPATQSQPDRHSCPKPPIAYRLAKDNGWMVTISVRSGETEDDWAADLAVGWSGDQFKNGSITQSERLAKYNRPARD